MHRIVDHLTGSLRMSVQDQIAAVMNLIAGLEDRYVLVKSKGFDKPFLTDSRLAARWPRR